MKIKNIIDFIYKTNKWTTFFIMLLIIVFVSTLISVITNVAVMQDDAQTRPQIAVVMPSNNALSKEFKQGVNLYIESLNRNAQQEGRRLYELVEIDEKPSAAQQIVENKRIVGVLGYFDEQILSASAPTFAQYHIPVVTPIFISEPLAGVTSLGFNPKEESRFIANYARNIKQQRVMYIIRESSPEFEKLTNPFYEIYSYFETPIKKTWTIDNSKSDDNITKQLEEIAENLKNVYIGGVYVAASPELSAKIIKKIRSIDKLTLDIYGPSQLSTYLFSHNARNETPNDSLALTHGIITTSPLLFDTANEQAQYFQAEYLKLYNHSADWMAAFGYESTNTAITKIVGKSPLKSILNMEKMGDNIQIPIHVGKYIGNRLISAPIQLLPISREANFNYIEALRQGRVLYVNDRFMFKTNVVYVGVTVNNINNIDFNKETAQIDLMIWFRYSGNSEPQNIKIDNIVEPIKLDSPVESEEIEDVIYRRYHIKETFKLNFTNAKRAYGQHIAGLSFRHGKLNLNNLMYVVDILGMPNNKNFLENAIKSKALSPETGFNIENTWGAQDIVFENSDGEPRYVNLTGEQPSFSKITFGMLLKPTSSMHDTIPNDYFIYIAIFGIIGSVIAVLLDFHRWGRFWALQSWVMRAMFWPLMLFSLGNMTIDWAFNHVTLIYTHIIVIIYESLWWLIAAKLVNLGVNRFIWDVLTLHGNSKIPNVIKLFITILIYACGFSGVVVFVFNQSPTSLLATSGVLAMVIGMAIKDVIANVFSGIILNFERQFTVGDKIKINNVMGTVKDITWRTTRIESDDGHMISLANRKVTEAFMENFSNVPSGISIEAHFYTITSINPDVVMPIITNALSQICEEFQGDSAKVNYKGTININGDWMSDYVASYRIPVTVSKSFVKEKFLLTIRQDFLAKNIPLIPVNRPV